MSRRGNCWDTESIISGTGSNNLTRAGIESLFKTLKTEAIYQHPKPISVKEMKRVIAEYMGHDNRLQPHSTIGYLSPVKFERERMEHLAQMEKT